MYDMVSRQTWGVSNKTDKTFVLGYPSFSLDKPTPDSTLVSEEVQNNGTFTNLLTHFEDTIKSGAKELETEEDEEITRQTSQF